MIQLVSAAIGGGVALLLLAISIFNGVDWLEALFHAAISGGGDGSYRPSMVPSHVPGQQGGRFIHPRRSRDRG